MASTTSDSLPSSPSIPTTAALDGAADQEFSSSHQHHHHHHSLFFPSSSSSSPASLYLDSSFHGLLPTTSSSTAMSSSPSPPPPVPPLPPAPAAPATKPAKKRPRASRRPPTTVLTTDTSNFRAMVQEFTGFPAPPFAPAPPPAFRPRLLGGPPSFLMRPSPLKYSVLLPPGGPSTCTTATTLANATASNTSSLVDALALFTKSSAMPSAAAAAAAATAATSPGGSGVPDHHYHHGITMGGFNPFDDFDAPPAAEGERGNISGGSHGFFSSFATGDKYGRH
ncbi:calmodulin-binding protein 25-like isoform X2 [Miscanthus floridulus]|uniref:calmodulin-binding protein 25-like isoform X1 n=1 Tax=Miscanthus floridulus TaxID=154761 RepID=UPI0034573F99